VPVNTILREFRSPARNPRLLFPRDLASSLTSSPRRAAAGRGEGGVWEEETRGFSS